MVKSAFHRVFDRAIVKSANNEQLKQLLMHKKNNNPSITVADDLHIGSISISPRPRRQFSISPYPNLTEVLPHASSNVLKRTNLRTGSTIKGGKRETQTIHFARRSIPSSPRGRRIERVWESNLRPRSRFVMRLA